MKKSLVPSALRRTLVVALSLSLFGVTAFAQTIPNPSFEENTFTAFPGYIGGAGNGPINGWTASNPSRVGQNPAAGSPFANNGTIPNGANVAFIQSEAATPAGITLSTVASGLTVGQAYTVTFRITARYNQRPNMKVEIDGSLKASSDILAVSSGAAAPYNYFAADFTAAADTATITLRNDVAADSTVVVDDFSIAPKGGWSWTAWTGDSDSGVDGSKRFTHAYNFGSANGTIINGISFTGVAGGSPQVAGRFSTANLPNVFNNDGNNIPNGSGSRTLANDFCYGAAPNVLQGITINGLTPGVEYVATIYSVGWEDGFRSATFAAGNDRLTINQDQFGNNNGIRVSYRYTAAASSITLNYQPLADKSFHTYGFINYEANTPTPPTISRQPVSQCVQAGNGATFSVVAAGSAPLTYQWRKDGVDIDGETGASLVLPSVSVADSGIYTVFLSNPNGTLESAEARLEIGLPVANPSFEANSFGTFPGYTSGNGPITGWTALGGHGLNPAGGNPFADNGTVPDGNNVAFMQENGALSQMVSGFAIGADYYVVYYENARSVVTVPSLEVKIGDLTVVPTHPRPPVGGNNPYVRVQSDIFTADAETMQLSFIKSNPQGNDSTALIDNVCVVEVPQGTPTSIIVQPQDVIAQVGEPATFTVTAYGTQPFAYQWYKGGSIIPGATSRSYTIPSVSESDENTYSVVVNNPINDATSRDALLTVFEPIPDLFSTGLDPTRLPLADGQSDPHYTITVNADGTAPMSAIVQDSTVFPIVAGPWVPNTPKSKWVGPRFNTGAAAVGLYTYRTTFNLTDRDPSTVVIMGQWSVDNAGRDILVNGVSTGSPQNPGFNVYTPFTLDSNNAAFVDGVNTIDFVAENFAPAGYTGLRVEFLKSNVKIPPGIPPSITAQPQSRKNVIEGDTVVFAVTAEGSPILTYEWSKDGTILTGETGPTLTLDNVTDTDVGFYVVTVRNDVNSIDSEPAALCIGARRIPGVVFGTGVSQDGIPADNGSIDLHYILAQSDDPAFQGPDAIVVNDIGFPIGTGPWVSSGPKSKWIAAQADQSVGNAEGNYTFQTFFNLSGLDVSKLRIVGQWAVDNTGVDILVNGLSTGITSPGFGGLTPFTLSSGLIDGDNVLDFKMNNAPATPNPTGLRVDLELIESLQPTLTITPIANNKVKVEWSPVSICDRLLYSTELGPNAVWLPVTDANSVDMDTTSKFFKIVQ